MSTSYDTGTYIGEADTTVPADNGTQGKRFNGAAEIRKVKSQSKASFPNVTGAVTASHTELNVLDGVSATLTAAELSILDGVTATTAELNILDGVTATTAELNILDGVTATATEINYLSGVTANIQTQLDSKTTAISGEVTLEAQASTNVSSVGTPSAVYMRFGGFCHVAGRISVTPTAVGQIAFLLRDLPGNPSFASANSQAHGVCQTANNLDAGGVVYPSGGGTTWVVCNMYAGATSARTVYFTFMYKE